MADIVERLRGWEVMQEAAAEIARLRSRVAELEAALSDIAFNSNDLSGDPMRWGSVKADLALGGRIVDGD